jgi:restriction system protein
MNYVMLVGKLNDWEGGMARRRKSESLIDVLIVLPWWVSVAFGSVLYVVMHWIAPLMLSGKPIFTGVVMLSRSIAWLFFLAFAFIGLIAFLRSKAIDVSKHDFWSAKTSQPKSWRADPPPMREYSENAQNIYTSSARDIPSPAMKNVDTWTLEVLRTLEWKRFEMLATKFFQTTGIRAEMASCGADGGIDIKLFGADPGMPVAIVQCKAWNAYSVGVKEIREFLGVMTHEKVGRGVFMTTGEYTKEAMKFSESHPIELLDGAGLIKKISELPGAEQEALLRYAFQGDYSTPTCASCGIKMTRRNSKRGAFWGCLNFPRCRCTFAIK